MKSRPCPSHSGVGLKDSMPPNRPAKLPEPQLDDACPHGGRTVRESVDSVQECILSATVHVMPLPVPRRLCLSETSSDHRERDRCMLHTGRVHGPWVARSRQSVHGGGVGKPQDSPVLRTCETAVWTADNPRLDS